MHGKFLEEITMEDVLDIFYDSHLRKYTSLKKQGPNYTGLCIFHKERKPSFYIRPLKNDFVCYGCGIRGGPLILLANLSNNEDPFYFIKGKLKYEIKDFEKEQFEELLLKEQEKFGLRELFNVSLISSV